MAVTRFIKIFLVYRNWFIKQFFVRRFFGKYCFNRDWKLFRYSRWMVWFLTNITIIQRKTNIIWFNPLISKSVVKKIDISFLRLIDKHFPLHHKLHKFFNKKSMANVKSIIKNHNKTVLDSPTNFSERTCNCIKSASRKMHNQQYHV